MIIDAHTHIFPRFFREKRDRFFVQEPAFEDLYQSPGSKMVGRDELLANMDKEGVQKSVVFGFPWEKADHFRRHNDYVLESVERHPDRLIGLCCFSPLSSQAPTEAARCLASGLSGVGELAIYRSALPFTEAPALKDIMEICLQCDVPVLLHCSEPVGHPYPGKTRMPLSEIYEWIKNYPSNKVILAHWGGGLLFYFLMKREVKEILGNTWFDTAASPFLYGPEMYRVAGEIIGFEKVLLGSDYPLLNPGRYLEEMASAGLAPESIKKVAGENAARLLGRSG